MISFPNSSQLPIPEIQIHKDTWDQVVQFDKEYSIDLAKAAKLINQDKHIYYSPSDQLAYEDNDDLSSWVFPDFTSLPNHIGSLGAVSFNFLIILINFVLVIYCFLSHDKNASRNSQSVLSYHSSKS